MDATVAPTGDAIGFSLADRDVLFNPTDYYRELREKAPVHYDAKLGLYVVSRYDLLDEVLHDSETYSLELGYHRQWAQGHIEEMKAILARDGQGYFPDVIMSDPPRHGRIRRLLEGAFTPRRLKLLEPGFSALLADIVAPLAARGEADGIADIAVPMTVRFITGQLGLGNVDAERIKRWSEAYNAQFSMMQTHDEMVVNAGHICDLQNYVIALIHERRARPGEDMISDLIRARLPGEADPELSFGEIVSLVRALLIGGNDTISTALANLLFLVATDAAAAARLAECVEDDRALNRFVEETLRLEPPVRGLSRVTTREAELGGVRISAGAQLLLLFASANDDEGVFGAARDFDTERSNLGRHLSFGAGIHRCVGLSLARMEVKMAAREIARRLTDIRLAVPVEEIRHVPTIAMLSMEALPLRFSARM